MKKILFVIISLIVAATADAASVKCRFDVAYCDTVMASVAYTSNLERHDKETILVSKGEHVITIDDAYAVNVILSMKPRNGKLGRDDMFFVTVLPGETISVSCDAEGRHTITGSAFNDEQMALDAQLKDVKGYDAKYAVKKAYVAAHPSSPYAVYLAALDILEKGEMMALVSDDAKTGVWRYFIEMVKDEKAAEDGKKSKLLGMTGSPAPDFKAKSLDGSDLALYSLFGKGKYILLDFWGSWCTWCLKAVPQMKTMYNANKARLEILSVDCNDTDAKWRNAVREHDLPWLHVKSERTNNIADLYGVMGFPTFVLIAPDGKVVKVQQGVDDKFYGQVDEIINK